MSTNPLAKTGPTAGPRINTFPEEAFYERVQELYEAIAQRAFSIFESKGAIHGRDFDDWLEAESDFLNPLPVEFTETDTSFVVRAEAPGFLEDDIEIIVEPRRLFITGTREEVEETAEETETLGPEVYFQEVFRCLDLPGEVDPSQVTAVLNDGILEIIMVKQSVEKADQPAEAA
jgi:HSP20 family protein